LESRNFQEGGAVHKDQLLYTIDPLPFEAKVVEAEGRLAEARTRQAKAEADLERIEPLAKMNAVSQQDLDGAVAQRDASLGGVQAAEAQLNLATIELGYTKLVSPIDGIIGISQAEVGELVGASPNTVILNYVSLTDPIRVRFSINERDYLRLSRMLAERRNRGEPEFGESDPRSVEMILADGTIHEYGGEVVAADASIDPQTGTFTLEADFPNPDSIIIAGQFARVRVVIDDRKDALLIPQRAISELQGNFRVFVVKSDGIVEMRAVQPGPQVGQLTIINSGLKVGEHVAIEGLLQLRDGAIVKPKVVQFPEISRDDSMPEH
ncbi:MAG: efflux RND transporter periplasmic adaptor subunit, partial [Halioglobus sp.]|nr:efflux RND transporter periplasmic adaptor subunit [Halioglobus sp.]